MLLKQSPALAHFFCGPHFCLHSPPQSTSDSAPSLMPFWQVGSSMMVVPVPAYVAAVDDPLSLMESLTRCDVSLIVKPVGCFPQLSLYLERKHGTPDVG